MAACKRVHIRSVRCLFACKYNEKVCATPAWSRPRQRYLEYSKAAFVLGISIVTIVVIMNSLSTRTIRTSLRCWRLDILASERNKWYTCTYYKNRTNDYFQAALHCFPTLPGVKNNFWSTRDGVLWFEENYSYSVVLEWGPGPLISSILRLNKVCSSSCTSSSWVQFSCKAYLNFGKISLWEMYPNIPPGLNKIVLMYRRESFAQ